MLTRSYWDRTKKSGNATFNFCLQREEENSGSSDTKASCCGQYLILSEVCHLRFLVVQIICVPGRRELLKN